MVACLHLKQLRNGGLCIHCNNMLMCSGYLDIYITGYEVIYKLLAHLRIGYPNILIPHTMVIMSEIVYTLYIDHRCSM